MNIWDILGIPATDDIAEIRRAYADQLKTHHPEDDPDGFQRLREAYEQALKYIKIRAMIAAEKVKAGISEPADETEDWVENAMDEAGTGDQADPFCRFIHLDEYNDQSSVLASRTGIKEFFESALTLYEDFYARIDIENWKKVLQAEHLWDMNLKEEIRWDVLRFFVEHPDLPQTVWHHLDSEFYWSERRGGIPPVARHDMAALSSELDPYWNFDYSYFHKNESVDFERYSQYRRRVKTEILEANQEAAAHYFDLAVKIYSKDLTFFLVYHDYLHSIRGSDFFGPSLEERMQSVKEMIDLYPDNPLYLLQRAKLYMEQSLYEKAVDEYKRLLQIYPDNLDILVQMMRAYKNMNRKFREMVFLIRILFAATRIKHKLTKTLAETNSNHDVMTQIRINESTLRDFRDSEQYKELTGFYIFLVFIIILSIGIVFIYAYKHHINFPIF